jgi:predicted TPR repeat methyltransferase
MKKAIELAERALEEIPDDAELMYRMVVYQITAGHYREAFTYLENALILDFEKHEVLFEFFPKLETQKALFKIIDQYRSKN